MGVIDSVRGQVRWAWAQTKYDAQTEGWRVAAHRVAVKAGLRTRPVVPQDVLQRPARPAVGEQSAAAWPSSLLVLAPADPSFSLESDAPAVMLRPHQAAEAVPAMQLASDVLVHRPAWAHSLPNLLAEASRLRLTVRDIAGGAG